MYIKRKIFKTLLQHLDKKEITMLVGPRQAGKTTLMLKLRDYLQQQGHKTLFLNLDFPEDRIHFSNQLEFIKFLELQLGNKKAFVFIDEVQRLPNAGLFLKGIYDRNLPYKFIVSGSGSLELKEKIHESLTGRKLIFEVFPVDFEEFINFKTNYKFKNSLNKYFELQTYETHNLLHEYLAYGGYPAVVLEQTLTLKKAYIKEIYQSYLMKDVTELLNVEKTEKFNLLVEFLAAYIGRTINKTRVSQTLGISVPTLDKYLWYLENTFIIQKIKPFFTNPRKELVKEPIYYFIDLGLRNFVHNRWINFNDYDGFIFQNFIFNLLKSQLPDAKINFWRTKDKAEVDFIIRIGNNIFPVETKNQDLKKLPALKSLRSFINQYSPKKAFVINKTLKHKIQLENTILYVIPYYEILKIEKYLEL